MESVADPPASIMAAPHDRPGLAKNHLEGGHDDVADSSLGTGSY